MTFTKTQKVILLQKMILIYMLLSNLLDVNLNTYTSFFFLFNIYYLLDTNDTYYLVSFIALFIVSTLFHYTKSYYLYYIDKLTIFNIILTGGLHLYENYYKSLETTLIIILCFLFVIYLYIWFCVINIVLIKVIIIYIMVSYIF